MQRENAPPLDTLELLAAIHGLQTDVLTDEPTSSEVFERLLSTLLQLTASAYGFIGERRADPDGAPYLVTRAISDIAWDDASRRLYEQQASGGLEFRNLDSLFGVTIRGGGPVLSDSPADDPRATGLPAGHPPLRDYLGLPIERGGELLGMVGIANRPGGYDEAFAELLAPFCSTCAGVLLAWRAQSERRDLEARVSHGERLASLGLLASRVAHDLNNALMGIKGRTHVARRRAGGLLDKELSGIEDAVDRMGELTRELLTFAGGREHRVERLDLGRLVEDVRVLLELALPPAARIDVRQAGSTPVLGDPAPLRQVLMNFVTNASEAMRGAGRVELRTGVEAPEALLRDAFVLGEPPLGDCCVAVVRDRGPGVPPELLEAIFDPFVTTKRDGRGLGLAGVPGILARHDGCVAVRNEPDGGASFAMLLPLAPEADELPVEEPRARPVEGGRVAVLERDAAVRQVTCRVLSDLGWQALSCDDLDALLVAVAEHEPSAVVLDASGPPARGHEGWWRLRERAPDLPIVLTAGFAELGVERGLGDLRHVVVLPKPFGGRELAEALARAVSGRGGP